MADSIFPSAALLFLAIWALVIAAVNIAAFGCELFQQQLVHVPQNTPLTRRSSEKPFAR
ncbi:MAG TPA: hypothetical protein VGS27_14430 [Candidatus Sulfotelmatobacter sp.]|nr:hypothetical protein [Candidatus Sulfotelmatobacter sp.]